MEEYYTELENYNLKVESGHYQIGILFKNGEFEPVYYSMDKPLPFPGEGKAVSSKQVQSALKDGTATPELLQAEIDRIGAREKRAQELDAEKIQLTVHCSFSELAKKTDNHCIVTKADIAGARLIIYQSLDYSARSEVNKTLLLENRYDNQGNLGQFYDRLSNLSDQEFCYLIRMAMLCKSESKYPNQPAGYFLYQMAEHAGIDVKSIEETQNQKKEDRIRKQQQKVTDLEKGMDQLSKK